MSELIVNQQSQPEPGRPDQGLSSSERSQPTIVVRYDAAYGPSEQTDDDASAVDRHAPDDIRDRARVALGVLVRGFRGLTMAVLRAAYHYPRWAIVIVSSVLILGSIALTRPSRPTPPAHINSQDVAESPSGAGATNAPKNGRKKPEGEVTHVAEATSPSSDHTGDRMGPRESASPPPQSTAANPAPAPEPPPAGTQSASPGVVEGNPAPPPPGEGPGNIDPARARGMPVTTASAITKNDEHPAPPPPIERTGATLLDSKQGGQVTAPTATFAPPVLSQGSPVAPAPRPAEEMPSLPDGGAGTTAAPGTTQPMLRDHVELAATAQEGKTPPATPGSGDKPPAPAANNPATQPASTTHETAPGSGQAPANNGSAAPASGPSAADPVPIAPPVIPLPGALGPPTILDASNKATETPESKGSRTNPGATGEDIRPNTGPADHSDSVKNDPNPPKHAGTPEPSRQEANHSEHPTSQPAPAANEQAQGPASSPSERGEPQSSPSIAGSGALGLGPIGAPSASNSSPTGEQPGESKPEKQIGGDMPRPLLENEVLKSKGGSSTVAAEPTQGQAGSMAERTPVTIQAEARPGSRDVLHPLVTRDEPAAPPARPSGSEKGEATRPDVTGPPVAENGGHDRSGRTGTDSHASSPSGSASEPVQSGWIPIPSKGHIPLDLDETPAEAGEGRHPGQRIELNRPERDQVAAEVRTRLLAPAPRGVSGRFETANPDGPGRLLTGTGRVVSSTPASGDAQTVQQASRVEPSLHIVSRDENFWTISRLYYGSGRYYRALWKANSEKYPDIQKLYVNDVILIPAPEDLDMSQVEPSAARRASVRDVGPVTAARSGRVGPVTVAPSGRGAAQVARAARIPTARGDEPGPTPGRGSDELELPVGHPEESPAAGRRMLASRRSVDADDPETTALLSARPPDPAPVDRPVYKVRRLDTLRSIARDMLGDSHRADEIYEINRDAIPNPTHLVAGQLLELPEDADPGRLAAAASEGGRD